MNEMDLNVKVVIDKSSVKSDLNEIKQDLGSVSDKAKSGAKNASSQVVDAVNGVKNAVKASIGATMLNLATQSGKVRGFTKSIKSDIGDMKEALKDILFDNSFGDKSE